MKKNIVIALLCLALTTPALFSAGSALEGKLLFGIGHFGARYLYHTYLTIGLVSDAWAANAKSPEDTKAIVQRTAVFLQASIKYFNELKDFALSADDRQYILGMNSACRDLLGQAESFLKYIDKRRDSDRQAFSRYRDSAWAKIAKLNGLE
ncbi:MAG: hypothetical protein ABII93_02260 [Chrysiogenia bacterium]